LRPNYLTLWYPDSSTAHASGDVVPAWSVPATYPPVCVYSYANLYQWNPNYTWSTPYAADGAAPDFDVENSLVQGLCQALSDAGVKAQGWRYDLPEHDVWVSPFLFCLGSGCPTGSPRCLSCEVGK
jgi:hypothetical protein